MKHLKYFGMGLLIRLVATAISVFMGNVLASYSTDMVALGIGLVVAFGILGYETYLMGRGISK